jgi:threonine dehydrogenase-like Zn-dependent dehydrogenase
MHTDYARVPHHLTAHLPERVTFSQGAYAMLAATALHALRRGDPDFGAFAAIIGLGLVGQLSAQIHKLAGCYVIGWDIIEFRTATARKWGIDETVVVGAEDPVAKTHAFTDADGLDNAVFAFGGDAERAMESVLKCMKVSPDGHPMGTIVFVGQGSFRYTSRLTNIDIRRASRTGPGYHDEAWEYGADYPPVFMRWTTRTNIALCLRLIAEGKLNVDALTTHTIPLEDVDAGISDIIAEPDEILGVVFKMNE